MRLAAINSNAKRRIDKSQSALNQSARNLIAMSLGAKTSSSLAIVARRDTAEAKLEPTLPGPLEPEFKDKHPILFHSCCPRTGLANFDDTTNGSLTDGRSYLGSHVRFGPAIPPGPRMIAGGAHERHSDRPATPIQRLSMHRVVTQHLQSDCFCIPTQTQRSAARLNHRQGHRRCS
ncbi:hypothetical protein FHT77_005794 [Rhizobium sp. BK181]|nr:hypothetical protein [Rhizobium sp. BK181]